MVEEEMFEFTSDKKKTRAIVLSLMEDILATEKELAKSLGRHGENEDREYEVRKFIVMEEMRKSFGKVPRKTIS